MTSESLSSFSSTTDLILAKLWRNWKHGSMKIPIHFVLSSFTLAKWDEVEKAFMMSRGLEGPRKSMRQPIFSNY
jgi:hypothetical protein